MTAPFDGPQPVAVPPDAADNTNGTLAGSVAGMRVWITGASRGLGRAIADDLAAAGARVALTARSRDALDGVYHDCAPGSALRLPGSVADDADVAGMCDVIRKTWGGLDGVVHCAGISPVFTRSEELDLAVWREIVDVNLTGTFLVCKSAAALMDDGGSIVTLSSVHARSAGRRLAAYSASKGAVESLTRVLALDWAERGIRVNCVAPGYFATDMTDGLLKSDHQNSRLLDHIPLRSIGRPAQLTGLVRLLLGPGGTYITGSVLPVDGGWTAA